MLTAHRHVRMHVLSVAMRSIDHKLLPRISQAVLLQKLAVFASHPLALATLCLSERIGQLHVACLLWKVM